MTRQACLVAALLLATPAAALAAPGVITTSVNLRAGPSVEFPVVNRLPKGVPVEIHGCIKRELWCDVSWQRERGWVAAQYLDYFYDGRYVALPSYVEVVDVPATSFVLTSYWSSFYFGRPFFRRHAWWNRHWQTQTHVASQVPAAAQPATAPAQMGNGMTPAAAGVKPPGMAMTPAAAAGGRGQVGVPAVANASQGMTAPAMQGRDRSSGMRPPMTSGGMGPANAMRAGGVPMAAHAQFGGLRGGLGGGMPHTATGGASQVGGAMRNGGGGRDSGGGGHHRH